RRRAPAAPAAGLGRSLADHGDGVEAAFQGPVEVRDQVHATVLARAQHHRRRRPLPLDPVGLGEQRVEVDTARTPDVDVDAADLLLAARLESNLRRLLAARAFLARPLQLTAELVGLARACAQERIRLARGHRLDAAAAGPA